MEYAFETFLLVFMMILGLGLLIAGVFTVYFGSGKSRGIGAGLLVGGIVLAIFVFMIDFLAKGEDFIIPSDFGLWDNVMFPGLIFLGAALLGGATAVGMFLLAIMKSSAARTSSRARSSPRSVEDIDLQ